MNNLCFLEIQQLEDNHTLNEDRKDDIDDAEADNVDDDAKSDSKEYHTALVDDDVHVRKLICFYFKFTDLHHV